MFFGCTSLVSVNTTDWDTSNIDSTTYMFYYCNKLESLNISNFNLNSNVDVSYMFSTVTKLYEINAENCNETTLEVLINALPSMTSSKKGVINTKTSTDNLISLASEKYWNIFKI